MANQEAQTEEPCENDAVQDSTAENKHITVRPVIPTDGTDMGHVHVAAWQVGYRGMLPDDHLDGLDADARGRFWTDHLTQESEKPDEPDRPITAVAEVDGRVVGMTTYGQYREAEGVTRTDKTNPPTAEPAQPDSKATQADSERFCELWSLNVDPEFWGTGAAQALMTSIIDGLRATRPEREVALWVLEDNARGRRFYEKTGWAFDGHQKSEVFAGQEITEVRYTREL